MALLALATALPASADTIDWYFGQNPPSQWMNLAGLYQKLDGGVELFDLLDQQTAGFYTNLTLTPTGSAFLATMNPPANTAASVYQLGVENPIILPPFCTLPLVTGCASGQIPVDNTKIFVHGIQKGNSTSLGPFTPSSTGGQAIAYLVEAQVTVQDLNNTAITVYQSNGIGSPQTQPRDRVNVISYQLKASSSAVSPTIPTVDVGWVAIASIIVPNGTPASLSGSTIAAFTPFSGFPQNTAVVHLNGSDTGAIQVSGTITGSQFISTVSTGTPPLVVTSTTVVPNLNIGGNAATATTLAGCCLSIALGGNGTATPTLTSSDPNIVVGGGWGAKVLSMLYPLVATNLTINRCVRDNSSQALVSAAGDCVTSVTTSDANIVIGGTGTAPTVALNVNPTFNSITSTTSVQGASVKDTGLTASDCVRATTGGVLASATSDCISSVTTSLPIVASISGSVLSVTCPTCASTLGLTTIASGSSGNISVVNGTGPIATVDLIASPTITGTFTSSNATGLALTGTGSNTISSNATGANDAFVYNATNASSPTGNLANWELIGVSKAVITVAGGFVGTNVTDSALTATDCVQASTGGLLATLSGGCIISVSAGSNIAASTTSGAVTVSLASPAPTALPSACAGFSSTFVLQYTTCSSGSITSATPGPNIAITNPTGPVVTIALASPAPTAAPSACAGFSSTFVLQYYTCPSGGGSITSIVAGSNGSITNGSGPTVTVAVASPAATSVPASCAGWDALFNLQTFTCLVAGSNIAVSGTTVSVASPVATAAPSACAGWSATFVLQQATAPCALIGVSKAAFTITVLPTANSLSTPTAGFFSRAYQVSLDMVNPTVDGAFGYCDVAGAGTSKVTFQFYESFGTQPTFNTALPIATAVSWPTGTSLGGGATFAPTAFPTSTTAGNPTWVFAVVKAIPATAPTGVCSFELHGLQRIIQ